MNNDEYNELHTLRDDEVPNLHATKVTCNGCTTLTEEHLTCVLCEKVFCLNGCIEENHKLTNMDLCLCCQGETDQIIERLAMENESLINQVKYYEEKENG